MFDMSLELVAMEIYVPEGPAAIAGGLVVEVGEAESLLWPRAETPRAHALAELDGGDEAVAARAVVLFVPRKSRSR